MIKHININLFTTTQCLDSGGFTQATGLTHFECSNVCMVTTNLELVNGITLIYLVSKIVTLIYF